MRVSEIMVLDRSLGRLHIVFPSAFDLLTILFGCLFLAHRVDQY